ncbi:MAG: antitoxin family protein [Deltaproteobacteria bacterium]|nr:antitoxin family protein [Deltaproteobacteria bacterium]
MPIQIHAVYENGVLKPFGKVNIPEHKELDLIIITEEDTSKKLAESQSKAMQELIGIGNSGLTDVARTHDKYIYSKG